MSELWVQRFPRKLPAAKRLFVFPYAGAGSSVFRTWPQSLPPSVEVCGIQLPGRETRIREKPFDELEPLLACIAAAIQPFQAEPFALFGHSFGGVLAFALAEYLRATGAQTPRLVMVSGARAPHLAARHALLHPLPPREFIELVSDRYRAIPRALLDEPELLALLLPALRADIAVVERYKPATPPTLSIPMIAFGGLKDQLVTESELAAWRDRTSASFDLEMFDGDHFFLNEPHHRASLLLSVERALALID